MSEGQLKGLGGWDRNERWSDRPEMRRDRDVNRDREFGRSRDYDRSDRTPW